MSSDLKEAFESYLFEENKDGSGKAGSYLLALKWLREMLKAAPEGFADCIPIWSVDSMDRLIELRERVLEEQKKQTASPWVREGIPVSYLRDGYCSAALAQLIEFFPQFQFSRKVLGLFEAHTGDDSELASKLNIAPEIPDRFVHEPDSKDGKERLHLAKARIGQRAFRDLILKTYRNRCCLTGLELPGINRASHIVGWAERTDTRMDPRNGLCLSATYDAAFDRKLITFDEDYRMVLSKSIRERVPSQSLKDHFLSKEGQRIEVPPRFRPLQEYLEHHRKGGTF